MKHPTNLVVWPDDDIAVVARRVADLRYDVLAAFLLKLSDFIEVDAETDLNHGRSNLAACLSATAGRLFGASDAVERAWTICKPYMKEDDR